MGGRQTGPRLIIVCGLPGSGKTSLARQLEASLDAVRFCADEWMDALGFNLWDAEARQRIEDLQWKMAQKILELGHCAVIEWGTWSRSERDVLRAAARSLGAAVELHVLDVPVDVLFARIQRRNLESPAITLEDVEKWARMFEGPSAEEIALFDSPA